MFVPTPGVCVCVPPPPGCHLLNFFLPLHLSVHKLATNAFQVVVINCLEDFKGPFGQAYVTAGCQLRQADSPLPPDSPSTDPQGTHWCPWWHLPKAAGPAPSLQPQEGRFGIPEVGCMCCGDAASILLHGGRGPISAPVCVWYRGAPVPVP